MCNNNIDVIVISVKNAFTDPVTLTFDLLTPKLGHWPQQRGSQTDGVWSAGHSVDVFIFAISASAC